MGKDTFLTLTFFLFCFLHFWILQKFQYKRSFNFTTVSFQIITPSPIWYYSDRSSWCILLIDNSIAKIGVVYRNVGNKLLNIYGIVEKNFDILTWTPNGNVNRINSQVRGGNDLLKFFPPYRNYIFYFSVLLKVSIFFERVFTWVWSSIFKLSMGIKVFLSMSFKLSRVMSIF